MPLRGYAGKEKAAHPLGVQSSREGGRLDPGAPDGRELSQAGWQLQAVSTDNGSEFRSQEFRGAVAKTGAEHRFIHAGRPQSNGCVERVQRTVLEECWRPSFGRSMIPKYIALRRDLVQYLRFYNFDRAHTGRHTAGRTPAQLVYGARKMRPR